MMAKHLQRARDLRRKLTDAERFAWGKLRNRRFVEFKFRRQVPMEDYIIDFVCFDRRLVVELDGGQHGEVDQREYDERRTKWLESQGFHVLRFWNHDVLEDWETVEDEIWRQLQINPSPGSLREPPSPTRGEG